MRRKRVLHGLLGILKFTLLLTAIVIAAAAAYLALATMAAKPLISYWTKSDSNIGTTSIAEHIKMYDGNGSQFADVWSEDRDPVASLDDVSPSMKTAIISAEDKDFYHHGAINLVATIRSVLTSSGGGSGITQQLVKNLRYLSYGASDKTKSESTATTISRKMQEMKIAVGYERTHSKDEILLKYLNTVSIGSPNVYGIETASERIFGKNAKDLSVGEAAALAGSVNNTNEYNLMRLDDKDIAANVKSRQKYVLGRMLANGYISRQQYDDAVKEPIATHITEARGGCGNSAYPFYCQYVLDYMAKDTRFGATQDERNSRIAQGGFAVYTHLDPNLIRTADAQVKSDLGTENRVAMPMAFVQPGTGGVLAIASNRDWGTGPGQTEVPLAESGTQTGSTYKMITLATAVSNGWTEDSLNQVNGYCPWTKAGYDTPAGGIVNAEPCSKLGGRIGYLKATAWSSNTYYVELSTEVGIDKLMDMSRKLGLNVPSDVTSRSASFTLGVASDSPIQMAAAYATFSNKGVYCPATPVKSYSMLDGSRFSVSDSYDPSTTGCKSVLTPKQASIVLKAQNAVINDASIPDRLGADGGIPGHQSVGKTGTTNDLANSSWTVTTGQYTAYANTYDPRGNYAYPLTYYVWRGMGVDGYYHAAMMTVKDIMAQNLSGKPNVPLDLNSTDDTLRKVRVSDEGMKVVPDVTGMSPTTALKTMEAAGVNAKVLKVGMGTSSATDSATYSPDTIVWQSVAPGTRLSSGSTRLVELKTIQTKGNDK